MSQVAAKMAWAMLMRCDASVVPCMRKDAAASIIETFTVAAWVAVLEGTTRVHELIAVPVKPLLPLSGGLLRVH